MCEFRAKNRRGGRDEVVHLRCSLFFTILRSSLMLIVPKQMTGFIDQYGDWLVLFLGQCGCFILFLLLFLLI